MARVVGLLGRLELLSNRLWTTTIWYPLVTAMFWVFVISRFVKLLD